MQEDFKHREGEACIDRGQRKIDTMGYNNFGRQNKACTSSRGGYIRRNCDALILRHDFHGGGGAKTT